MNETSYNFGTRKDEDTGKTVFSLEGNLGIEYISEIRKNIPVPDQNEKSFVIEIKNAYKIDISTVQLIYSWIKSAHQKGIQAELKASMRDNQKALIHDAGFTAFI